MVSPFLYNGGAGEMVPISKIVRSRNMERPASKRLPGSEDGPIEGEGSEQRKAGFFTSFGKSPKPKTEKIEPRSKEPVIFREVCWKLSERGTVGETGLHMCLLVATVVHLELARRLVRLFPKLVNDVYASDEYYGD